MRRVINKKEYVFVLLSVGLISSVLISAVFWLATASVDNSITTEGNIVLSDSSINISHNDGGLVEHIAVNDGDWVEKGQLILNLQTTALDVELEQVIKRELEVKANIERLSAQRKGNSSLIFSQELMSDIEPKSSNTLILEEQTALFLSNQQTFRLEIAELRKVVTQSIAQIEYKKDQIQNYFVTRSFDQGYLPASYMASISIDPIDVYDVVKNIDNEKLEGEIARLVYTVIDTRSKIESAKEDYQIRMLNELYGYESQLSALSFKKHELKERIKRTKIRAPTSGVVTYLNAISSCSIILAKQSIIKITPDDKSVSISARVPSSEIREFSPGVTAEVRFKKHSNLFDKSSLPALVLNISDESYIDETDDTSYFKATLQLSEDSLESIRQSDIDFLSTLPLEIEIDTYDRPFMEYIVSPLKSWLRKNNA